MPRPEIELPYRIDSFSIFDSKRHVDEELIPDVTEEQQQVRVVVDGEATLSDAVFDRVLVAIGRRANSDELGLAATHVKRNERDFIIVDEQVVRRAWLDRKRRKPEQEGPSSAGTVA